MIAQKSGNFFQFLSICKTAWKRFLSSDLSSWESCNPFVIKIIITAAKRIGADLIETAAPVFGDIDSRRNTLKTYLKTK